MLAIAAMISTVLSLAVIWNSSTAVSHAARHAATAGLGALPLAVWAGIERFRSARWWQRIVLTVAGAVYIGIPLAYGPVSVVAKTIRNPTGYRTSPVGLYNPLLSANDAATCSETLTQAFDHTNGVWYLTDPNSALDLEGRAIIVHADMMPLETLASASYSASRPIRVFALLPPHFEDNGKGPAIRRSFLGAHDWQHSVIPGCKSTLWVAVMERIGGL